MSKIKGKSFRKEALETTLKKKKESSTKALETVEKLIEKNVTKEILLQNVQFINQASYQDIIDERCIMNICGYPICSNELRNIPKQQFRITRTNGSLQLYDTTERKKFCSNFCFKATKYLKDQLPTCPLWLIEHNDNDFFKLLAIDCKYSVSFGEQINFTLKSVEDKAFNIADVKKINLSLNNNDNNENSILNNCDKILHNQNDDDTGTDLGNSKCRVSSDFKNNDNKVESIGLTKQISALSSVITDNESVKSSCNEKFKINGSEIKSADVVDKNIDKVNKETKVLSICNEISEANKSISFNQPVVLSEFDCSHDKGRITIDKCTNNNMDQTSETESTIKNDSIDMLPKKETSGKSSTLRKKEKIKCKVASEISPMLAAVLRTEQCVREWVSLDTLYFLLGEDKLKNLIQETCGLDKFKGLPQNSMEDPLIYERYVDICKKLKLLELAESKFDKSVHNEIGKNNIGPTKPVPDIEKLKKETKEMEIKVRNFYRGDKQVQFTDVEKDKNCERAIVRIPLVDRHAQKALRRRIVLDNLNRVLPDLVRALGLNKGSFKINCDIKTLVESFTLSAHNITFRPAEWNFIGIIVIKLLSVRDEVLHKALLLDRANKYLTLMLMSYEQDSGYLNRLLTWLLYEHTLFNI